MGERAQRGSVEGTAQRCSGTCSRLVEWVSCNGAICCQLAASFALAAVTATPLSHGSVRVCVTNRQDSKLHC